MSLPPAITQAAGRLDRRGHRCLLDRDRIRFAERPGSTVRGARGHGRGRSGAANHRVGDDLGRVGAASCPRPNPEAFWNSIRHAHPAVVGLNCSLGGRQLRPHVEELARIADAYVCAYPSAGLPNAFGEYEETAEETADILREFAARRPAQHGGRLLRKPPGHHPSAETVRSPACRPACCRGWRRAALGYGKGDGDKVRVTDRGGRL